MRPWDLVFDGLGVNCAKLSEFMESIRHALAAVASGCI